MRLVSGMHALVFPAQSIPVVTLLASTAEQESGKCGDVEFIIAADLIGGVADDVTALPTSAGSGYNPIVAGALSRHMHIGRAG